jgi:hypothetical protein
MRSLHRDTNAMGSASEPVPATGPRESSLMPRERSV